MGLRKDEEWARRIVESHLGCEVYAHDDGTEPSMYDLRVGPHAAPELAIEVSAAVDEKRTQTWNTGPARGAWSIDVPGDWMLTLAPEAHIKTLRRALPEFLRDLRAAGVTSYAQFEMIQWRHPMLYSRATAMGIAEADQYEPNGIGTIHFTMEGAGGPVDSDGFALPGWIGDFLRDDRRSDVLRKLGNASAPLREVFVPVTMDGAPWSVVSYLTDISSKSFRVPPTPPDLPTSVTGVWVVSTMSFGDPVGVRWSGMTWEIFKSRGPGIDDEEDTAGPTG